MGHPGGERILGESEAGEIQPGGRRKEEGDSHESSAGASKALNASIMAGR